MREYADARGVCLTDGFASEAVELVLRGRAAFEAAVRVPSTAEPVLGEGGFQFVDAFSEAYRDESGLSLPDLNANMVSSISEWDLRIAGPRDFLPLAVVVAMDAAFDALEASAEVRAGFRLAGIESVEVYGGLSHHPVSGVRLEAGKGLTTLRTRSGRLFGSFVWSTAELMGDDFDGTVDRVRTLVAEIAARVPNLPHPQALALLDGLADNGVDRTAWYVGPDSLLDTVDLCVLERAAEHDPEAPWARLVPSLAATPSDLVSWARFAGTCAEKGQVPEQAVLAMVRVLRGTRGATPEDVEDDLAAAAILSTWPSRAASPKASADGGGRGFL
ncbi:hypothetical protein [Demequina sp.]|uniref:hypothetical protein n=1 Tax=Demequina sp. TaxID=2050685 RepID=UPI003D0A966C